MDIRLVVTDLDGTFLSPDRTISDRAVETVAKLRERGVLFTFITGRPWCGAERYALRAGIDIPVITCNGAVINNGYDMIWRSPMLLEPLREILERAVQEGLTVLYSQAGREAAMSETDWTRQRNYTIHLPSEEEWKTLTADKVNLISGEKTAEFVQISTKFDKLRDRYQFVCYTDTGCEIAGAGVTKASALERYAASQNIPMAQVMAIGDNENDLEMLRLAGTGAAVGNATASAKAAADYICRASNTDGVVEAIEKFCLGVEA